MKSGCATISGGITTDSRTAYTAPLMKSIKKMKCILLTLLACVATLEAKPFMGRSGIGMGLDIGTGIGMGIGAGIGTGIGLGMWGLGLGSDLANGLGFGLGVDGLGMGLGRRVSENWQGGSFGYDQYNSGENGFGNQGFHNGGFNNFHDIGHHHSSRTLINHAENTDSHDIGGSEAFDTGAQSNTGFNQFDNGRSRFGNEYRRGHQISFL